MRPRRAKPLRQPAGCRKCREVLKQELIYLPFFCFRALYSGVIKKKTVIIGVDAVKGRVTRFEPGLLQELEEGGSWNGLMELGEAKRIAEQEARWPQGIFSSLRLSELSYMFPLLYPFWVLYLKGRGGYRFEVFDAITGRRETPFASEIVAELIVKEADFS